MNIDSGFFDQNICNFLDCQMKMSFIKISKGFIKVVKKLSNNFTFGLHFVNKLFVYVPSCEVCWENPNKIAKHFNETLVIVIIVVYQFQKIQVIHFHIICIFQITLVGTWVPIHPIIEGFQVWHPDLSNLWRKSFTWLEF